MFKKIPLFSLFVLCFIFIYNPVIADVVEKPVVMKINSISMYKNVFEKILRNTEDNDEGIRKRNTETDQEINIDSKLMDIISDIYQGVISTNYGDSQNTVYEYKEIFLYEKTILIHVMINKREKLISSLDIEIK